jgi:hypothetical protein
MSQTQTDPTQTKPSPPTASGAAPDDPLSHLHKMSTTAGLGSGDYVAVNGTAVFALLVGLASALALMSEVLLILPLVAVVAACIAWSQIRHSNDTQTGKGLVIVAMVLALGFGGFVFGRWATEGIRTREDRKAIEELVKSLDGKLKAADLSGAYQLFGEHFVAANDLKKFTDRLTVLQGYYGKITKVDWNGLVEFQSEPVTGDRYAFTIVYVSFEKAPEPLKDNTTMHKTPDGWQIERMNELFPPPQQPGQQQPGQGRQ